jgi:hypothetical protein
MSFFVDCLKALKMRYAKPKMSVPLIRIMKLEAKKVMIKIKGSLRS